MKGNRFIQKLEWNISPDIIGIFLLTVYISICIYFKKLAFDIRHLPTYSNLMWQKSHSDCFWYGQRIRINLEIMRSKHV